MKKRLIISLTIGAFALATGVFLITNKEFFKKENSTIKEYLNKYFSEENIKKLNNEDNIQHIESTACYAFDLTDVEKMYEENEYIAIVHIDKVKPATTYKENIDKYIKPYTPGEATILKVLKGNFESNKISFLRLGGTVSYEEYLKSLYEEARQKFSELFDEDKKATLKIEDKYTGDINIEEGKNYLVYMTRSDDFHKKNEYTFTGFEYGLREVNLGNNKNKIDTTITVKNNKTGEYETFEKSVSKKIINKVK